MDSGPVFLGINALQNGQLDLSATRHVTGTDYERWTRRVRPRAGDIVFSYETRLGAAAIIAEGLTCCLGRRMALVRTHQDRMHPRFFLLQYLAEPFQTLLATIAVRGATVDRIPLKHFPDLIMSVPPLAEQERIVRILDEALDAIDRAQANTKASSVSIDALFQATLDDVIQGASASGKSMTLSDVLAVQPRNGWSPPAAHHAPSGTPVLTLSSVTGFTFKADRVKHTSAETSPVAHYWVHDGDLLMTRSNTPRLVGHVALASGLTEPTVYPDLIMRMRTDPRVMISDYAYFMLRTLQSRNYLTSRAGEASQTMSKITKRTVQTMPVFVPSQGTQAEAVGRLHQVEDECQTSRMMNQAKSNLLADLRAEILSRAFNGYL